MIRPKAPLRTDCLEDDPILVEIMPEKWRDEWTLAVEGETEIRFSKRRCLIRGVDGQWWVAVVKNVLTPLLEPGSRWIVMRRPMSKLECWNWASRFGMKEGEKARLPEETGGTRPYNGHDRTQKIQYPLRI